MPKSANPSASRHVIPGSERTPLPGARSLGAAHPQERLEVTVQVRARTAPAQDAAALGDQHPGARRYLTHEEYAATHGADPKDLDKVEAFAKHYHLAVVARQPAQRSLVLAGTVADVGKAFGTAIEEHEHDGGSYRGRSGPLSVPGDLGGIVEGVFGIDNRPAAKPHFQVFGADDGIRSRAAGSSFTPVQLAQLYEFPSGADGSGQCIALIELGGGWRQADLATYFKGLGLPTPKVKTISVDHGRNHPTNANSADGEVMLDIEVAAAVAPKATIAVYFAPNTDQGFLDAINAAIHDTVNKPSVVSISWGSAESNWTQQAMTQFDQAFQAAALLGVTVCVAAGDNGSADGVTDGAAHVDFPASSPNVLGCGGTKLTAAAGKISSEVAWNEGTNSATGGGVSGFFALPAYQKNAKVPARPGAGGATGGTGRGVPDVAGDADPATGYQVRVDGQNLVFGGTSAVAPLWAGLVALMNQKLGHRVGFLNPLLYGSLAGKGVVNDISTGNNGAYTAQAGWDACTGWGSPKGAALLKALSS
jgi:kumamolisin